MVKSSVKSKGNTGKIITVVVAVIVIVLIVWVLSANHSSNSNPYGNGYQSTSTIPQIYTVNLYSQGQVFSLKTNSATSESFSIPSGSYALNISGSYTSSDNTDVYLLNSVQYGAFTQSGNRIQNYTWYSGTNKGSTISIVNFAAGDTYYLVFYSGAVLGDTVTVVNPIVVHYTH